MILALLIVVVGATIVLGGWLLLVFMNHAARIQAERLKQTAERDLADMFVFVDYRKLTLMYFIGFIAITVLTWMITHNPVITVIGAVVAFVAPKLIVGGMRKHRLNRFRMQLPDALVMMSSSLRAGASLATTLENLAREAKPPLSQEFSLLLRNQKIGMSFEDALRQLEARVPLREVSLFSAGVRISREAGGSLGEMLDSLASTLTRTLQTEGKIRSLTAMGKIQGWVMASLPLLVLFALNYFAPQEIYPMFHSIEGYVVLAIIAVLEVLGYLGIRMITNIDV